MTEKYTNNSTHISNSTVSGNQFAAGSKDFSGTLNNITDGQQGELERLTEGLINALNKETNFGSTNKEEIVDAVNQVSEEAKKSKVNKLSISGIVSGINIVMTNLHNISSTTQQIYTQWHDFITNMLK